MYANKMNRTLQRTRDSHQADTIQYIHVKNVQYMGCPVAQSVEQAPHVHSLCPCAADLGSIPPVALCCMSFPLSLPCFLSTLQLSCIKGHKSPKNILKKKKKVQYIYLYIISTRQNH